MSLKLRKYEKFMEKKMSTPIEAHTQGLSSSIDSVFVLQLSFSRSCVSTSLANLQLASRFLLQSIPAWLVWVSLLHELQGHVPELLPQLAI